MRVQCPECGFLRPAGAEPCPSCGADAPAPSGGTRAGSGTSLRQWKERYQTGQLPGIPAGPASPGKSGPLPRRTSGPLTMGQGQSNPNWGNESPSNSIPPGASLGIRRSGSLTPPPDSLPPTRRSGSLSSPVWPSATDPTPPPPGRSSGLLSNPARTSGSDFGNGSASWKWRNQGAAGGTGLGSQMNAPGYDDADSYQDVTQDEPPPRASGRLRDESMLPVPYQSGRRPWGQGARGPYDAMDDQEMGSGNVPAPMGMGRGSSAFPSLMDGMSTALPPGRKAPAFIPATRARRPYRLSNYRIISGTISVALVVLLVVGGLGFLLVKTNVLQHLLGSKPLPALTYQFSASNCQAPSGTPQATPSSNAASKIIVKVMTAKDYSKNYDPIDPTPAFKTGETVNVLWEVRPTQANTGISASAKSLAGTSPKDTRAPQAGNIISVKWYQDCNAIGALPQSSTQEAITDNKPYNGVFGLCYPTSGVGMAELYWNNQLAQTIQFVISGSAAPCS